MPTYSVVSAVVCQRPLSRR